MNAMREKMETKTDAHQETIVDGEGAKHPCGFSRLLDRCKPRRDENQSKYHTVQDGGYDKVRSRRKEAVLLHSIWSELETIKQRVEDILAYVGQRTQDL
jgi:hypothetical protein